MAKVTVTVEVEIDTNVCSWNTRFAYSAIPGVNFKGTSIMELVEKELIKDGRYFKPVDNACIYCGREDCVAYTHGESVCG